MQKLFKRFVREEDGQDLIEYGLLVGIITAVVVGLISTIGEEVLGFFQALVDALALA